MTTSGCNNPFVFFCDVKGRSQVLGIGYFSRAEDGSNPFIKSSLDDLIAIFFELLPGQMGV
jgi:hypothetical protein